MRRKYDIRNKRTFIIILILSIIIIGIFSLFIYKYKHAGKVEYKVSTGSIVQDNSKNYVEIAEDAILKVKWSGNYYLIYQDRKINLGKKVIVYDTISNGIKLYGKLYEITESGKIVEHTGETSIRNNSDAKFYKLDDREYLLVDRQIVSEDKSIDASNYLLVELDKMGNAKLSNNKLNLKTIKPTTLITSKYTFDIANEELKFDTLDVDLKKIIGSTNQYKKEEKKEEKEDESNVTEIANNNQVTANGGGAGATTVNNNNENGQYISIEELKRNVKMTSLIRAYASMSQIDVDYVVYDPYNEYKSIYAEINKNGTIETVQIVRTDTHMVFEGLSADTSYKINFYYTTIDEETEQLVTTSFGELNIHTKKPQYSVKVYKISGITNMLYYKVYLQEGYEIDTVDVTLSFDCQACQVPGHVGINRQLSVNSGDTIIYDQISLADYSTESNIPMTLTINSVNGPHGEIAVGSYTTFRIGR